jgi:hypothetical protein
VQVKFSNMLSWAACLVCGMLQHACAGRYLPDCAGPPCAGSSRNALLDCTVQDRAVQHRNWEFSAMCADAVCVTCGCCSPQVEVAAAHRGRLSLLVNLLGKPLGALCTEMEGKQSDFRYPAGAAA